MVTLQQLEAEYEKVQIWFDPNFEHRLNNLGKVYDTGLGEFLNASKDEQTDSVEIGRKKPDDQKSKFKAFLKSKKDDSQNKSSFSNSLS